jgi:hypothetical protein
MARIAKINKNIQKNSDEVEKPAKKKDLIQPPKTLTKKPLSKDDLDNEIYNRIYDLFSVSHFLQKKLIKQLGVKNARPDLVKNPPNLEEISQYNKILKQSDEILVKFILASKGIQTNEEPDIPVEDKLSAIIKQFTPKKG